MNSREAIRTIGSATLIVGGLDFVWATMNVFISGGSVTKLWQFVASGVFGQRAYSMGVSGALSGVIFHFSIMAVFSLLIYVLYKRIPLIERHPIILGLVYGSCIWFAMNLLVVPLSNAGTGFVRMKLDMILSAGFAINFVVHMILGLLLVLITKRCLTAR